MQTLKRPENINLKIPNGESNGHAGFIKLTLHLNQLSQKSYMAVFNDRAADQLHAATAIDFLTSRNIRFKVHEETRFSRLPGRSAFISCVETLPPSFETVLALSTRKARHAVPVPA